MKLNRRLSLAFLSGALLLASCNDTTPTTPDTGTSTTTNSYPAGNGTITGIVVDQNIGAAVAGSTVTLYQSGKQVGTFQTDSEGKFTVTKIAAGTYDFKARKAGMAGSDLYGVDATADTTAVRIIQRPAFDTSATTTPPKLDITTASGAPIAGTTFTDGVNFRIKTAADSDHVPPIRVVYAQLGRMPGSGSVTSSTTSNNWIYYPQEDLAAGTFDTEEVSLPGKAQPNFLSGYGTAEGEKVFLNIVAVDFNYNYVTYSLPIILKTTSALAKNTVLAPTKAAATAFTLKQEGSWTTPYAAPRADASTPEGQAAPSGSGIYVDVRWCYTEVADTAKPLAFDIERSTDGTTFKKIGTVAGNSNKNCSADPLQRPFNYKDNSADLSVGTTYTYRVVARGANTASSNTTETSPLGQFSPVLVSPGDEATGVSLMPTFVIKQNQTEIGADGVGYNLRFLDLYNFSGFSLPGPVRAETEKTTAYIPMIRVEEGTGEGGNGIPAGQSVVFVQNVTMLTPPTSSKTVVTDTAGVYNTDKPNLMPVDLTAHQVSIPMELFTAQKLQPLRPYQWEMNAGIAYKYAPKEGKRVSAYSVYTWPSSTKPILPIGTTRAVNQNFDFVTGDK